MGQSHWTGKLGHGTTGVGAGMGGVQHALLTCKSKALLFPVFGLINSRPNDFLHQILRVGAVDAVRIFYRTVRHFRTSDVLFPSCPLRRHILVKKPERNDKVGGSLTKLFARPS